MYHGGSFADIDEDGKPEIVIGSYDDKVYVLNGEDGSLVWDYTATNSIASPTSIADLNNDEHLEIVFTSYNILGVLSHEGNLLWSYPTGGSLFRGASIADTDDDSVLDVVFGSDDGILRVLRGDTGQLVWSIDLEEEYGDTYQMDHAPTIADFDNDGKLDIFIIGGFGTSSTPEINHGRAYVLTAGNGTGPGWPMFRHDLRHSACFENLNQAPIALDDYTYTYVNCSKAINITKNDFTFAMAPQIPELMEQFERNQLSRYTPCVFKNREGVVKALAEAHTELLLIHPFRDGNGRVARLLSTLMALQAELPLLDFNLISEYKKQEYITAVQTGLGRNYQPMETLFSEIIEKSISASAGEQ